MKDIFRLDSLWVQRFAMLTNLVVLNILWIICCIPVITAGAATCALYGTIFQYHTNADDAILRPFFRGFRSNFKQSTMLFLPLLAVLALLGFDLVYLVVNEKGTSILFLLMVAVLLVMGILVHLFPLIARFEMGTKALLRTALSLVLLHLPSTLTVIALTFLPVLLLVFHPSLFLRIGVAWAGIWFSGIAYFFGKFLLKTWVKHMPAES